MRESSLSSRLLPVLCIPRLGVRAKTEDEPPTGFFFRLLAGRRRRLDEECRCCRSGDGGEGVGGSVCVCACGNYKGECRGGRERKGMGPGLGIKQLF